MSDNSVDRIVAAFDVFCRTGKVEELSELDVGYITHALVKAKQRAGQREPTIADHQLFLLLSLSGEAEKIEPFLLAVGEKARAAS